MADKKSILLRLPQDLWADVKRLADAELRSVNAQIEYTLRQAVRRQCGRNCGQEKGKSQTGSGTSDD